MLFFVVLVLVALGQQGVLSASFRFNFSSSIEQCAPLQISYSGINSTDPIPTSLLLLPLNSTPFSIPIPNAGPSSTGLNVSFLPLAAGTQFIASLDDSSGDNAARVSDVFQVQPSSTNSCIPADPSPSPFFLPTSVSQCAPFSIGYQDATPSVRVFIPNGGSFSLNPSQNNAENQTALYTLNVTHGVQVLLMAFPPNSPDSGLTTSLLTVEGDGNSDSSCIAVNAHNSTASSSPSSSMPVISNKGLVIGLAVGGAVITLVALMMLVYIVQDRRKRRRAAANVSLDMLEKSPSDSPRFVQSQEYKLPITSLESEAYSPFPGYNLRYEPGFVRDPPYTSEDFSPSNSEFGLPPVPRGSDSQSKPTSMMISRSTTIRSAKTASSINPYDIEEMLDVAAEEMPELPESTAKQAPGRRSPADLPTLTVPRNVLTRGHLRSPEDVPQPASVALSSYLGEKTVLYDSPEPVGSPSSGRSSVYSFASSSNFEILTRPTNTLIVTSPRQPPARFSEASALQRAQ